MVQCVPAERYQALREEHENLKQLLVDIGMRAFMQLHQVQKDRVLVLEFLRISYPDVEVTPDELYDLDDEVKRKCKEFLREQLAGSPIAKQRIDDVFAYPKKSRSGIESPFRLPVVKP